MDKRPVPRKLNEEMITAICEYVKVGNYYHDACAIVGITEQGFYNWINQAKEDEVEGYTTENSIYLRLVESLQKARAEARAEMVSVVRKAAVNDKQYQAAVLWLERTDPTHWGRKEHIEHTVATISFAEIQQALAPIREWEQALREGKYYALEERNVQEQGTEQPGSQTEDAEA